MGEDIPKTKCALFWRAYKRLIVCIFVNCFVLCFAFVEPHYEGWLDFSHINSSKHKGSGSFLVSDFHVKADFFLGSNYKVYYNTSMISKNMEAYNELYLDIDNALFLPTNIMLGRFDVPFGLYYIDNYNDVFLRKSVIRSVYWGDAYLVPNLDTGVALYYDSRFFSLDFYVVNGEDKFKDIDYNRSGHSLGTDMRMRIRDFVDVGMSFYYNNSSTELAGGDNDGHIVVGTDSKFTIGEFDFLSEIVFATGKKDGSATGNIESESVDGNGIHVSIVDHFSKNLDLGVDFSYFQDDSIYRRFLFIMVWKFSDDLKAVAEIFSEEVDGVNDNGLEFLIRVSF